RIERRFVGDRAEVLHGLARFRQQRMTGTRDDPAPALLIEHTGEIIVGVEISLWTIQVPLRHFRAARRLSRICAPRSPSAAATPTATAPAAPGKPGSASTRCPTAPAESASRRARRKPERHIVIRRQIAAELHAAIHLLCTLELVLEREIARLAVGPEDIRRAGRLLARRMNIERIVFHTPVLRVAGPAVHRGAVENLHPAFVVVVVERTRAAQCAPAASATCRTRPRRRRLRLREVRRQQNRRRAHRRKENRSLQFHRTLPECLPQKHTAQIAFSQPKSTENHSKYVS